MRSTLTIKTRLLLTAGFVAATLGIGSGLVLSSLRTIGQEVRQLVQQDARLADLSADVAVQVSALFQSDRTFFLQIARSRDGSGEFQRWTAAYARAGDRITELGHEADAQGIAARLQVALRAYEREFVALRQRLAREAIDPAGPDGQPLRDASATLDRQATALFAQYRAQVDTSGLAVHNHVTLAYPAIGLGVLLGLFAVAAILWWFVYQPIISEARSIVTVCDAVAVGDLTSRVLRPSGTELGVVGRSLNSMLDGTVGLVQSKDEREQMQAAVMKLLEEVSGVADGDLTVHAEVTADITGAVADSFNFMIGQLRELIGQMQHTSRQVSTSLGELRSGTERLAAGSEDQAAQTVEASVAIEQMAASIHYVSKNAVSSAEVAEQARTNAEHGARAVTRTIEGMKAVRDQVQETSKRIKRLGESSQEIGEIVELIGDIADRTSILALNASIQAAMAGEAGRGFAVVADEVERLADRATEATKRAAMLVKTTQSETAEVMAAMEDTTREVINRSNIANEAGVALGEIQVVSNRLAELIQAISDAAEQQARGSEQVAKSMNEMSSVTRNTAAGTKQTASAINAIAVLVDDLNGAVSRFKLPASDESAINLPRLVASRWNIAVAADAVSPDAWSALIRRRCGLAFRGSQVPAMLTQIAQQMQARGVGGEKLYFARLAEEPDGGAEWPGLVERLLNHETSFFRHPPSFDLLRTRVLPEIGDASGQGRRVNFLSAGCSTGQEAYSLAMLAMADGRLQSAFTVWGGDISRESIDAARRGRYHARAVAGLPSSFRDRFLQQAGGEYEVVEALRKHVRFTTLNLLSPGSVSLNYDVIFCHNVLIYFSQDVASQVISLLAQRLAIGGYLVLGPGEGPSERPPGLEPVAAPGVRAFRRTAHKLTEKRP